jgi:superfamily II DNA or RNA helicase
MSTNMSNPFQSRRPHVQDNHGLRIPQREAYAELIAYANDESAVREVGVILPVGCGKSGCIALAPFAFESNRTLVVAPGVPIAELLQKDFDPTNPDMFYRKTGSLSDGPYPEPAEIRGTSSNRGDLDEAHVVITNIHQLQGTENRWLLGLPEDYFDLILFDEGHHNVASSWDILRAKFPAAKIVSFSATPQRADGQLMAGHVIYSYPVARAIQEGYVKRLKAVVLNPRSLRYVRREDGVEIDVTLDEVRQLGETDADFRRSIVTSTETLNTIVDASIRELQKLRSASGEQRLKIIASALNYEHCRQVVEAYRSKGQRADYVHSRENAQANKRVLQKLNDHELDVIVQVRKLSEGFDHPYLAVAAVFSIFSNLSPFIQFVGRIMRVVKQNAPGDLVNNGVVVFHAGANIARQWRDFQNYSEADQEYFDQLLPMEGLDFSSADELEVEPTVSVDRYETSVDVTGQAGVQIEEIPLIDDDPEALAALRLLKEKGYTGTEVRDAFEELEAVPTTKLRQRQAKRQSVQMMIRTEALRLLKQHGSNPEGHELDKKRLNQTNLVVAIAALNRHARTLVGGKRGKWDELTRPQLDTIENSFGQLVAAVSRELFDGN